MKTLFRIAAVICAMASLMVVAEPTKTFYPSLAGVYTVTDGAQTTNAAISTSPTDDTWTDNGSGAGDTPSKFYGGKIAWVPTANTWGSKVEVQILYGAAKQLWLVSGGGASDWTFTSGLYNYILPGYGRETNFNFIIKVEDLGWNNAKAKLFLNAQNQLNEPTNGYGEVTYVDFGDHPVLNTLGIFQSDESWESGSPVLTVTELYSGFTNWPGVPEPSLVFGAVLGLLALRRRK